MAVTRPSNSGTAGAKYRDASAGNTKIADIPGKVTIGTVTVIGTTATIPVTANPRGGVATLYTATSSPGGLTATSAGTSPINFPSLSQGTTYTFTVVPTSAAGNGPVSDPSNEITTGSPPPTLHYVIVGGGSNAGPGGGGGVTQNANYSTSGITSFNVTVGSAAGTSSFNGITASPGSGSTSGNGYPKGSDAGWQDGGGQGGGGGAGGAGGNANGIAYLGGPFGPMNGFGGSGGPGAATNIHGSTVYYGAGSGGGANQGNNRHLSHGGGGGGTGAGGANTGYVGQSGRVMIAYGTQYGPLTIGAGLTSTQDTSTRANHRVYTFTAGSDTVIL